MTVRGNTVLALGGWGLVGRAVCHELLQDNPKRMIICSLTKEEAEEAVGDLERERLQMNEANPKRKITTKFIPEYGDIFSRLEFKDLNARSITADADLDKVIDDTFNDLKKVNLNNMFLYRLIGKYKPGIIVDSINTATIVAYKDVYASTLDLRMKLTALEKAQAGKGDISRAVADIGHSIREHLSSIYLPRLIRHVQIIYLAMQKNKCQFYVKIGTTGTGGMGLNIPYTHSEEKPSQKLLSKSAVGGAHSLLLFLMSNTPNTTLTMEIKPAAAIAWKAIGFEEVRRGRQPIQLFDNPPSQSFALGEQLPLVIDPREDQRLVDTGRPLKAVLINTGENGVFSQGEFTAITTTGQMEYVTPEEIARNVRTELHGGNTGSDIVTALKNSVMSSTYRAGFMRDFAIEKLHKLEKQYGESVAFEILGPPRLSKLLYEAYLLKKAYGTPEKIAAQQPEAMARKLTRMVKDDADLRSRIISIGIPILLPDGGRMLRGPKIVSPPFRGENLAPLSEKLIDDYARDGWVDLRHGNMAVWIKRIRKLLTLLEVIDWNKPDANTSSRFNQKHYLDENGEINIGEIVGWIFNTEEGGARKGFAPLN